MTVSSRRNTEPIVVTFGCRLNAYESEVMRSHAVSAGRTNAIIVNTCAVTKEAERQGRQAIRRLRRENPNAEIIATGCAVQLNPTSYSSMDSVDQTIGNEQKMKVESFSHSNDMPVLMGATTELEEIRLQHIEGFGGRTRTFVQIQQGCNHRCTFCIIPFARGNNRSVPIGQIASQVRSLVANGNKEVVLTGVDIASYGSDLPGRPTLGQMLRRLLQAVPELNRLRLSTLDPANVDEDFFRLVGDDDRLLPHFHISAQSGDDIILKRMKRRHISADILEFCDRVKNLRPDASLGADFITGFPTETEKMFSNTLALVDSIGLTHLHVFPYSRRPGTPADRMPQVAKPVIKDRAARLRALGKGIMERYLTEQRNKTFKVLMEAPNRGYSDHYIPVITTRACEPGTILRVRITQSSPMELIGEPLV